MAAVTINRQRNSIFGDRRVKLLNVNIANSGDTLAVSNFLHYIDVAIADGSGTTVVNTSFTVGSSGPITFQTTGAQTNVDVMVIGK